MVREKGANSHGKTKLWPNFAIVMQYSKSVKYDLFNVVQITC